MSQLDNLAWFSVFDYLTISCYSSIILLSQKFHSLFSNYELYLNAKRIITEELPQFGTRKSTDIYYAFLYGTTILELMAYHKYQRSHPLACNGCVNPNPKLLEELNRYESNMYIAEFLVSKTKGKILIDVPRTWLADRELIKSVVSRPKQGSWLLLVHSASIRSDLEICKLAFKNRHPKAMTVVDHMIFKTEEAQREAIQCFGLECFRCITNKDLFSEKELMCKAIAASLSYKYHVSNVIADIHQYIPPHIAQTREVMPKLLEISSRYILNCSQTFYEEHLDLVAMVVVKNPELITKLPSYVVAELDYQIVKQCLQERPSIFHCLPLTLRQTPELIYVAFKSHQLDHGDALWEKICDGVINLDAIKAFSDCGHVSQIRKYIKLTYDIDQKTLLFLLSNITLKQFNRFLSNNPTRPEFVFTKEVFPVICSQFERHEDSFISAMLQYRNYFVEMMTVKKDPKLVLDVDMIRKNVFYFIMAFPILNDHNNQELCPECRKIIFEFCRDRSYNLSLMIEFIEPLKQLVLNDSNFVSQILDVNPQCYRMLPPKLRNSKQYPQLAEKVFHDLELRKYVKGAASSSLLPNSSHLNNLKWFCWICFSVDQQFEIISL
ncbi:hypothetical protein C9374_011047 [Naegleria lovaniensis]|uniref:Uncharacterized protein n=1 Tax=Naegleria lovaniensis TaxID=51637 RepID=A0AA88KCW1_NAELO|nr:uncharacterized protein C9374_011047 [Naegleria lovaniensis]KAG2374210.1 hypothetical protein C9374_011047 [Naegleria lovaniensis]